MASEIKGMVCVLQHTDAVFFGAHDGQVHAVDIARRVPLWTHRVASEGHASSAVFAGVTLDEPRGVLVCATLVGRVQALCYSGPRDPTELTTDAPRLSPPIRTAPPSLLWEQQLPLPVFGTPAVHPVTGHILVPCVDGSLYCLGPQGSTIWRCALDGPVFSSPLLLVAAAQGDEAGGLQDPTRPVARTLAVVGTHSGSLAAVCLADGSVAWQTQLGATVYSSPTLLTIASAGAERCAVAATSAGLLVLVGLGDGVVQASLQLPGLAFASPVVVGTSVFQGCRDDHVHRIDVATGPGRKYWRDR